VLIATGDASDSTVVKEYAHDADKAAVDQRVAQDHSRNATYTTLGIISGIMAGLITGLVLAMHWQNMRQVDNTCQPLQ